MAWLNEVWPPLRRRVCPAFQSALEQFFDLVKIDVVQSYIRTDQATHDGSVCICVALHFDALSHGKIVQLISLHILRSVQAVEGQNEAMLHKAHILADIVLRVTEEGVRVDLSA